MLLTVIQAWHAIELSKPYLAWSLSAKAAELCQTLGYHRMQVPSTEDAKFANFLFWTNYFIDKSLSLRLGRASMIPDWDITTRRPNATDPHTEPVWAYFALWTETARCQGNIYELLYSPEAIVQPQHVRQSRTEILANSMQILEQATQDTHVSCQAGPKSVQALTSPARKDGCRSRWTIPAKT
jgi:transcription factor-like protein